MSYDENKSVYLNLYRKLVKWKSGLVNHLINYGNLYYDTQRRYSFIVIFINILKMDQLIIIINCLQENPKPANDIGKFGEKKRWIHDPNSKCQS